VCVLPFVCVSLTLLMGVLRCGLSRWALQTSTVRCEVLIVVDPTRGFLCPCDATQRGRDSGSPTTRGSCEVWSQSAVPPCAVLAHDVLHAERSGLLRADASSEGAATSSLHTIEPSCASVAALRVSDTRPAASRRDVPHTLLLCGAVAALDRRRRRWQHSA
jgi:hypothetical protein